MKLLYALTDAEQSVYDSSKSGADSERIMYCLPYNYEDGQVVKGKLLITNLFMYKINEGTLVRKYDFSEMTDFLVESMLGISAFMAKINGHLERVCYFMPGRYLAQYTVISKGCKRIADAIAKGQDPGAPVENKELDNFCEKCGAPLIRGSKICPHCREKGSSIKRLWALTKGMRLILMFPVFASGISFILSFILPSIQQRAIDGYMNNPDVTSEALAGFIAIAVSLIVIDLFQRSMSVLQTRLTVVSGTRFIFLLRSVVFEKIQNLSTASIQQKSTGDLMSRLNNDIFTVQSFMTSQIPDIVNQILSFVLATVILLVVKPELCLFVFLPIIPVCLIAKQFWAKIAKFSRINWIKSYSVSCFEQDVIQGERIVKCYGREKTAVRDFKKYVDTRTKYWTHSSQYSTTVSSILGVLFMLGSFIILYYGNILVFHGNISLGELYKYTAYTSIIYAPLRSFLTLPSSLATAFTSINKITEILDEEPEIADIDLPIDIRIEGDIKIKDITFGYNAYNPVIENFSLEINQGEMIGIVGASGSGKTTLINLIMRLYDVNEGAIEIDDVNVKDISQHTLRSSMGIVLQETHLFHGSVRDNICYAKPYATEEEIIEAAKLANAHDFICSLPQGYNTIIGERGFSLSGGERQRIAIARAMIHNPKIIILDEATAALDTETEKMIQDSLNQLMKGRTTIAIAHRLSTLRNATKLAVLDDGHLAEFGTHAELLKKKGIYYKLVMAQRLHAVK